MQVETISAQDTATGDGGSARQEGRPENQAAMSSASSDMPTAPGAGDGGGSLLARSRSAGMQGRRSLFRR